MLDRCFDWPVKKKKELIFSKICYLMTVVGPGKKICPLYTWRCKQLLTSQEHFPMWLTNPSPSTVSQGRVSREARSIHASVMDFFQCDRIRSDVRFFDEKWTLMFCWLVSDFVRSTSPVSGRTKKSPNGKWRQSYLGMRNDGMIDGCSVQNFILNRRKKTKQEKG